MDNGNLENKNRAEYSPQESFVPNQNPVLPQYMEPSIYTQPPEPPKHRLVAIPALVITMAVTVIGIVLVSNLLKETISQTNENRIAMLETYHMKDRPHYSEMVELIKNLYDKYTSQDLTGEIWARFDSDTEDYNYVIGYLSELNYYHKKLVAYENQQSSNSRELDYEVETVIDTLNDLETRFIAKAPLTTTITITLEDGTQIAVDKKTKTSIRYSVGSMINVAQDIEIYADAPTEKEAWARGFEGFADPDGTYRSAAKQLAEYFDMYLDYNWTNILDKCIGSSESEKNVIAAYCHATPDVIYINKNAVNYEKNIRNIMFVSTIKHEISHHIIATICGTARPPIAGAFVEGVTNSFANIFLGAQERNEYYPNNQEYHMSEATNNIARAIHDEKRCNI